MNNKSNPKGKNFAKQCSTCIGSGYEERTPVLCRKCGGKKCIYCQMKSGYEIKKYETCRMCNGHGQIFYK